MLLWLVTQPPQSARWPDDTIPGFEFRISYDTMWHTILLAKKYSDMIRLCEDNEFHEQFLEKVFSEILRVQNPSKATPQKTLRELSS